MKVANYGRCIATVDYDRVCKKAYIDKIYRGHVFGQPPYIGTVVTAQFKNWQHSFQESDHGTQVHA